MPNLAPNLTQKRDPKVSKRVTLPKYIINATTEKLRESIIECSRDHYGQDPHEKQVDATMSLVRGENTFLLAGTGFGKSRVVELFLLLFSKVRNPIVLVLNPLDALGDNQVADKIKNKFTAINLTQLSFCHQVVVDILAGKYQFVYLSPEIFLNSPLFIKLYFNEEFQNRVVLKVVDEAHLIYSWGLVASGLARRSASWLKVQDVGVFRPSYGNLCARLTATEHAPVLLMSATCRPKAFNAILKNLRWHRHRDVTEVRADLVRYEIRFIRLTMRHTLETAKDLHRFFPPAVDVPDCDLPRTLIYSGTQNHTEKTMKAVNVARKRTQDSRNGRSLCARRFHADTGTEDKLERGIDFVAGFLAVICCTMALGLGQNWGIVQRVIVVGRADPATLCQMLGRCGRDQKPGLGFMLVERGRRGGKNRVEDFNNIQNMSDDDRMDALAITPVCLWVAFAIDNELGYIPLLFDDPEYIKEYDRQKKVAPCLCSNCRGDLVLGLMEDQLRVTQFNFNNIATQSHPQSNPQVKTSVHHTIKPCTILTCPAKDKIWSSPPFQALQTLLLKNFDSLYHQQFPRNDNFISERDMLTDHQAWRIAKNSDVLGKTASLREILGSEALDGQFDCILQTIKDWEQSDIYKLTGRQRAALSKSRVDKAWAKEEKKAQKEAEYLRLEADLYSRQIVTPVESLSNFLPASECQPQEAEATDERILVPPIEDPSGSQPNTLEDSVVTLPISSMLPRTSERPAQHYNSTAANETQSQTSHKRFPSNQLSPITSQPRPRLTVPVSLPNNNAFGNDLILPSGHYLNNMNQHYHGTGGHQVHQNQDYNLRAQQAIAQQQSITYNHSDQLDYSQNERYLQQFNPTINQSNVHQHANVHNSYNHTQIRQHSNEGHGSYYSPHFHQSLNTRWLQPSTHLDYQSNWNPTFTQSYLNQHTDTYSAYDRTQAHQQATEDENHHYSRQFQPSLNYSRQFHPSLNTSYLQQTIPMFDQSNLNQHANTHNAYDQIPTPTRDYHPEYLQLHSSQRTQTQSYNQPHKVGDDPGSQPNFNQVAPNFQTSQSALDDTRYPQNP